MNAVERDVRAFIAANYILDQPSALQGNASLTRSGVIDSLGVVELMHFLQTHFGIAIPDEETVPENIDSIDNIVRYIQRKVEPVTRVHHVAAAE